MSKGRVGCGMVSLRQRQPREKNEAFLRFVRAHACCACGAPPPSQAAHLRMGSLEYGKRETGAHEKSSDRWANPLCWRCHLGPGGQHSMGERVWWTRTGLDPFKLASDLYMAFERLSERKDKGCSVRSVTDGVSSARRSPIRSKAAKLAPAKAARPKNKLPSRPLKSASRWPKRKVR